MFGSRRRGLSTSSISTRILRCAFYYATFQGVVCFRLKRARCDGRLIVRNCSWYKWLSILIRILISYFYVKFYRFDLFKWDFSHMEILISIRVLSCLLFAVVIIVMQLLYGQEVLSVINRFFKLFRRANALSDVKNISFDGRRELTLLTVKSLSLLYELYYLLSGIINDSDITTIGYILCEVYTSLCTVMLFHVCFLGYLSVGALYDQTNKYVRTELRQTLKDLEQYRGGQPSHRQMKAAGKRLDECLSIYDEVQRVAMHFHKLFELVLGLVLLVGFLNMALLSYLVLTNTSYIVQFRILLIKLFLDLLVLTLAIHGARTNSRVVRRLSLENYYVCERNDWHMKLEMFLNRLNFYEFRIRPLGLFEVSNELILVFLSGLVTYLTYVLQYSMQSQRS